MYQHTTRSNRIYRQSQPLSKVPDSTHALSLHLVIILISDDRREPDQRLPPQIPHILGTRADPTSGPPFGPATDPEPTAGLLGLALEGHAVFEVLEAPGAGLGRAVAVYLTDLGAECCKGTG